MSMGASDPTLPERRSASDNCTASERTSCRRARALPFAARLRPPPRVQRPQSRASVRLGLLHGSAALEHLLIGLEERCLELLAPPTRLRPLLLHRAQLCLGARNRLLLVYRLPPKPKRLITHVLHARLEAVQSRVRTAQSQARMRVVAATAETIAAPLLLP